MKEILVILMAILLLTSCTRGNNEEEATQSRIEITEQTDINSKNNIMINNLNTKIAELQNYSNDVVKKYNLLEEEYADLSKELKEKEKELKATDRGGFSLKDKFRGITLLMTYNEVINAVGVSIKEEDKETQEHGLIKTLFYDDFSVIFVQDSMVDITINKYGVEVIRGIKIGDKVDEIGFNFSISDIYYGEDGLYEIRIVPEWGYWLAFKIKEGIIVEVAFRCMYT